MSTELQVALIASGASLLAAVISLVMSFVSNRHSARSTQEIEKLKYEFSRATARDSIFDEQQAESLKALQLAIKSIQRVKDEIQVILSAEETGLDSKTVLNGVRLARQQMFECYEEQLATLDNKESRVVHEAKNISLHVEAFTKRSLLPQADSVSFSENQQEQLRRFRMSLTEAQQLLRDSRADKIMRRLGVTGVTENSQADSTPSISAIDRYKSSPLSLEGLRLLVVDDQNALPEMVAMVMTRYGLNVRGVNSAVAALDEIINWKPDILISDVMMPDEDGYWLIEQIRSLDSELRGLPAIAVTGGYDARERQRLLSAGYTACFAKPVNPADVVNFVVGVVKE
jgi:CheY-like chemotaxis protein